MSSERARVHARDDCEHRWEPTENRRYRCAACEAWGMRHWYGPHKGHVVEVGETTRKLWEWEAREAAAEAAEERERARQAAKVRPEDREGAAGGP